MKDDENKVPQDEEVEITDLESLDQTFNILVSEAVVRFVQRVYSSVKKPIIFAFLVSILVLLPAIQTGSSSIFRQISDDSGLTKPASQLPLVNVSAANGTAYILAPDGTLEAHRVVDGMLLWQHKVDTYDPDYSATIADGALYFGLTDGSIEALQASNGNLLWHYKPSSPIFWYPHVVDGFMFIKHMNGTMDVLKMSTGAIVWRYPANK
ncbi:MAG TPA: PQQ-binding-like beta-propeller repeat protein [Ktedonobacteraceae bacterium]